MTRTSLSTILYCVVSNKTFKGVVEVTVKIDQHLQTESNKLSFPVEIRLLTPNSLDRQSKNEGETQQFLRLLGTCKAHQAKQPLSG